MHDLLIVHTDGAARGNPGPAGIGVVIESDTGEVVQRIARAIGRRTNNQAEYEAVIAGLTAAHALQAKQVTLMLDSELVAKQLRGAYRIKNADLKRLSERAQACALCTCHAVGTQMPTGWRTKALIEGRHRRNKSSFTPLTRTAVLV